jgi:hypothetical protein
MAKALNDTIYREISKLGHATSIELADRLDETRRAITDALQKLRMKGRIKRIDLVRHPEFHTQIAVWQAIPENDEVPVAPVKRYRKPRSVITKADHAWMKEQQQRAAAKMAFRMAAR